jgi:hypothetical protein
LGRIAKIDHFGDPAIADVHGPHSAFITGSDSLMDGGVTAAYWVGELAVKSRTATVACRFSAIGSLHSQDSLRHTAHFV